MLSETDGKESSFATYLSRHRRLADVKRGKACTRTMDTLADRQWNNNGGVQGLGCESWTEQKPQRWISLPSISAGHKRGMVVVSGEEIFSPWGSRSSELDKRLSPESRPKVIQPKRGIMMSRVASDFHNRLIKTRTNFHSRNGTVRIIEPVPPFPWFPQEETERTRKFNPCEGNPVERDHTFILLERIDQILNPAKMYFKSDLNSSEVENVSEESAESQTQKEHKPSQRNYPQRYSFHCKRTVRPTSSFMCNGSDSLISLAIARLAENELDAYQKCRIWVDRGPTM